MEQKYDYICLGTGLKECILSGLMSTEKKSVLHMDRNGYYGGESASLNMAQLYKKFRGDDAKVPAEYGRNMNWCVDLCPKFLMACGNLVKVLLRSKVTKYLEFKQIAGSFVFKSGKMHKVPATAKEALSSSLMGIFQKRKFRNFLTFVNNFDMADPKTHSKLNIPVTTAEKLYSHWGLDKNTQAFVGHAICLYQNDAYLTTCCTDLIDRAKLYAYSLSRYETSPYIYPMYGLGGLPEGFSRLSAIYGGTYMLNKTIDKVLFDDDGRVTGVESGGEKAFCDKLVADPSYFVGTDKIKKVGQVARMICIMTTPPNKIPHDSCQMILPSKQIARKYDMYISHLSHEHRVTAKGFHIAVISTQLEEKESKLPNPKAVLLPALKLLANGDNIKDKFFWVSDMYEPVNDPSKDGCYISKSYDASTHFESATKEVVGLYASLTGKPLDLEISAEPDDLEP